MKEIEELRAEIDSIQVQLASLFRQRLKLAHRIWEIKKKNNVSFLDIHREERIIHQFDSAIESVDEQKALQNFFRSTLLETKRYLEAKLK